MSCDVEKWVPRMERGVLVVIRKSVAQGRDQ